MGKGEGRAGQGRAGRDGTGWDGTGRDGTGVLSPVGRHGVLLRFLLVGNFSELEAMLVRVCARMYTCVCVCVRVCACVHVCV